MVTSVVFSPDGKRFASGSHDETVRLWDARTGQEILKLSAAGEGVVRLVFSPDDRPLVAATGFRSFEKPGKVVMWEATPLDETKKQTAK